MGINISYKDSIEHIEMLLSCLSKYVEISNRQGTNDINVACENLVILLLNSTYGYRLEPELFINPSQTDPKSRRHTLTSL